jgi:NAD(P)-dependent dehydrogenase (short-subunit alcohol dehydrogenase family)
MFRTMMKGAAVLLAVAQAASMAARASRGMRLAGKTALVCGASRGLGRQIALELARRGCRVAICARSERDLDDVRAELVALGATVHAEACDLRSMEQVEELVTNVTARLGPIDVLVPVAATMLVGPIETMKVADFDEAMASTFKTALHAALAVLPHMQRRKRGTIAFITSIGGKIGVPHLVPYSAAKFAEVGLAEGLRAETAKDGVHVLTVVPGLMRTGSHVHAEAKGDAEKEYAWFGASATAPMPLTIDAARAARRIVRAIERGDTELVLTPAAKLGVRLNGLSPGLVAIAMKLAGRLLPRAPALASAGLRRREGVDLEASSHSKGVAFVQGRGRALAQKNRQLA